MDIDERNKNLKKIDTKLKEKTLANKESNEIIKIREEEAYSLQQKLISLKTEYEKIKRVEKYFKIKSV
jgi:hypothetical protein